MKKLLCFAIAALIFVCGSIAVSASSMEDWAAKWDEAVSDAAVISVSPGADSTSLRFAWLTALGDTPAFRFGKTQNLSDADSVPVDTTVTLAGQKRCSVTVDSLSEDAVYYYTYRVNGAWRDAASVRTAGKTWTALFVSDAQLGRSGDWRSKDVLLHDVAGWDTTLTEALAKYPDISLCLSAGDQTEKGYSERQYRLLLAPHTMRSLPVATTIGNHEFYFPYLNLHFSHPNRIGSSVIHSLGDEPYYFLQQNALFIVLDTNDPFAWDHEAVLERAVHAHPDAAFRVVMMHHSLFSCEDSEADGPFLRRSLAPLMQKYGIDLVLSGHTHKYSRSVPLDGVTYLEGGCCSGCNCKASPDTLPGYTAAGYTQKNPVYCVLHFDEQTIRVETYAVENGESVQIDSGSVLAQSRGEALPQMTLWTRVLQRLLSVFGRAASLFFV